MINRFATKNHRAEDVEDQIASSSKEKNNNKKARNGITIYLLVLAVAFVFAIGVASGFAIASSSAVTTTSSELFLQDEPAGGGKAAAVPAKKQKRPLQIFPLLKELNSGWKNMEVRVCYVLYNMNALRTRITYHVRVHVRRANTTRQIYCTCINTIVARCSLLAPTTCRLD